MTRRKVGNYAYLYLQMPVNEKPRQMDIATRQGRRISSLIMDYCYMADLLREAAQKKGKIEIWPEPDGEMTVVTLDGKVVKL